MPSVETAERDTAELNGTLMNERFFCHLGKAVQAFQVRDRGHSTLYGLHYKVTWLINKEAVHLFQRPLSKIYA